jgi:hypothetical protein
MVLQTWIVPEPNAALSLSISNIDYRKLDHDDCRWIYSSTMKKYHKEFSELQGFINYAQRLFAMEDLRKNNKYIIPPYKPSVNPPMTQPMSPPSIHNKDKYIKLNTNKSIPFNKIPFIKKHSDRCNIN